MTIIVFTCCGKILHSLWNQFQGYLAIDWKTFETFLVWCYLRTIGYWIHVRAYWVGCLFVFYALPVNSIHSLSFFSSEAFSDEGKAIIH